MAIVCECISFWYIMDQNLWLHQHLAYLHLTPDSKVHGANMGPTWVLSAPDGPHIGPMNFVIRDPIPFHLGDIWCISNLDDHWFGNSLLPVWHYIITWINAHMLAIMTLRTNIKSKAYDKVLSQQIGGNMPGKYCTICLGPIVLCFYTQLQ